ncbi:hypothetical protein SAMN05192569_105322 [Parageobacillus thermantarcticus]|uniref:Uncharacterized protein n=1 Tax=Parageobacillus thermantarcticus TaxID=186116 RepID=A0A1I0TSG2_9BACL|nr:hypothetical protein [Parageobacillus thermantarcticus]SFA54637.1 hypothetical protein SAMN05192569_105322 [Parageobacillus thermantarcticus]
MKKHAILGKYGEQWSLNLGGAEYIDVTAGVSFVKALDEVSNMGWEVVSVFKDGNEIKALVAIDRVKYESHY